MVRSGRADECRSLRFGKDGTPWWQLTQTHLSSGWRDALQLVTVVSILGNTIASHNAVVAGLVWGATTSSASSAS